MIGLFWAAILADIARITAKKGWNDLPGGLGSSPQAARAKTGVSRGGHAAC